MPIKAVQVVTISEPRLSTTSPMTQALLFVLRAANRALRNPVRSLETWWLRAVARAAVETLWPLEPCTFPVREIGRLRIERTRYAGGEFAAAGGIIPEQWATSPGFLIETRA